VKRYWGVGSGVAGGKKDVLGIDACRDLRQSCTLLHRQSFGSCQAASAASQEIEFPAHHGSDLPRRQLPPIDPSGPLEVLQSLIVPTNSGLRHPTPHIIKTSHGRLCIKKTAPIFLAPV